MDDRDYKPIPGYVFCRYEKTNPIICLSVIKNGR